MSWLIAGYLVERLFDALDEIDEDGVTLLRKTLEKRTDDLDQPLIQAIIRYAEEVAKINLGKEED